MRTPVMCTGSVRPPAPSLPAIPPGMIFRYFSANMCILENKTLSPRGGMMIKLTTTKATHRGVHISVMSERTEIGLRFCCANERSKPKAIEKWFPTQGEAIANERYEIDAVLR